MNALVWAVVAMSVSALTALGSLAMAVVARLRPRKQPTRVQIRTPSTQVAVELDPGASDQQAKEVFVQALGQTRQGITASSPRASNC
ncbi:hypothetical protein [Amycolatopsis mediterranei]|uniref:hypothetical protein n=2 Tax=Amycolatopsis mediterranei TaxID=33910 RepID=UPI0033227A7F